MSTYTILEPVSQISVYSWVIAGTRHCMSFYYLFAYPPLLKRTNTTYRTKCKQATYCTKY